MQLATWNVNSIRARLPRLVAWLEKHRPDVVCLQETKVEDDLFPRAEIEALGYHATIYGQRTYNGVAILSREPAHDVVRGFDDGVDDPAARFLVARVGDLHVASVYVPNGQKVGSEKYQYKLAWLSRLRRWLDARARTGEAWAFCGDYNVAPEDIDVKDVELWRGQIHCSPEERAALAEVRAFGLEDVFRRHRPEPGLYSWWDYRQLAFPKNNGLRIDHVFGTPPFAERTRAAAIHRDERKGKEASDHVPVVIEL